MEVTHETPYPTSLLHLHSGRVMILAKRVRPVELIEEYRVGMAFCEMARKRDCREADVKRIVFERIKADDIDERYVHLLDKMMADGLI